jgi:penicillin-binding protein 1A
VDEGTAAAVRQTGFQLPAAGKTGTTDDFNDAWFTGFTPTLSACVWVGFDRGMSLRDSHGRGLTGARAAAPIWAEFMRRATEGEPAREFPVPADIRFRTLNPVTGQAALPWDSQRMEVALREGQERGPDEPRPGPPDAGTGADRTVDLKPGGWPLDSVTNSAPARPDGGAHPAAPGAGGGYVGGMH